MTATIRVKLKKGLFYLGRMYSPDAILDVGRNKGLYLVGSGTVIRMDSEEPCTPTPRLYSVRMKETAKDIGAELAKALASVAMARPEPTPAYVAGPVPNADMFDDIEPIRAVSTPARKKRRAYARA
jgi:hypothetical protein